MSIHPPGSTGAGKNGVIHASKAKTEPERHWCNVWGWENWKGSSPGRGQSETPATIGEERPCCPRNCPHVCEVLPSHTNFPSQFTQAMSVLFFSFLLSLRKSMTHNDVQEKRNGAVRIGSHKACQAGEVGGETSLCSSIRANSSGVPMIMVFMSKPQSGVALQETSRSLGGLNLCSAQRKSHQVEVLWGRGLLQPLLPEICKASSGRHCPC